MKFVEKSFQTWSFSALKWISSISKVDAKDLWNKPLPIFLFSWCFAVLFYFRNSTLSKSCCVVGLSKRCLNMLAFVSERDCVRLCVWERERECEGLFVWESYREGGALFGRKTDTEERKKRGGECESFFDWKFEKEMEKFNSVLVFYAQMIPWYAYDTWICLRYYDTLLLLCCSYYPAGLGNTHLDIVLHVYQWNDMQTYLKLLIVSTAKIRTHAHWSQHCPLPFYYAL